MISLKQPPHTVGTILGSKETKEYAKATKSILECHMLKRILWNQLYFSNYKEIKNASTLPKLIGLNWTISRWLIVSHPNQLLKLIQSFCKMLIVAHPLLSKWMWTSVSVFESVNVSIWLQIGAQTKGLLKNQGPHPITQISAAITPLPAFH